MLYGIIAGLQNWALLAERMAGLASVNAFFGKAQILSAGYMGFAHGKQEHWQKTMGIINFYVTPSTRLEFLLGKQIPYVVLAMASFLLLVLMAVVLFHVPVTGSFAALALGALLYVISATALGLLISTFVRSQVAALFGTSLLTILPAVQFSGLIDPVTSLEGAGRLIGNVFPTTHFVIISRGTFSRRWNFPICSPLSCRC